MHIESRIGKAFTLGPCLAIAALAAGLAVHSQNATAQDYMTANPAAGADEAYWSEERLRDAQPMPLPLYSGPVAPLSSSRSLEVDPGEMLTLSRDAQPGVKLSEALAERLYHPDDVEEDDAWLQDEAEPSAQTSRGYPFTTSRVFPANALAKPPLNRIGKLYVSFEHDVNGNCTAAVVARRLVLTAAHCVYNHELGGFARSLLFVPGYDRGAAPKGSWTWSFVFAAPTFVDLGLDASHEHFADFALLEIKDKVINGRRKAIGDVVGHFGVAIHAQVNTHITSFGYPGNLDDGRRLQQTSAQFSGLDSANAYLFGSYQRHGASGGPVIVDFGVQAVGQNGNHNVVIGVNSYLYSGELFYTFGASILNEEFRRMFVFMCKRDHANCDQVTTVAGTSKPIGQS